MTNPYDIGLDQNPANYQPLTPLTFLERAALVFPKHTAIIHGKLRRDYAGLYMRCCQFASVLDRVATRPHWFWSALGMLELG